jgi:hypothetical protein
VTARLRSRLRELFPPGRPFVASEKARPVQLDGAVREKLRALGY